jgi:hypothetical protein
VENRAAWVRVEGPLTRYADGFRTELATRGSAPSSAAGLLQLMAHLSWWLGQHRLDGRDLTTAVVEEFLPDRRSAGYRRWLSPRGLRPPLEHLRGAFILSTSRPRTGCLGVRNSERRCTVQCSG